MKRILLSLLLLGVVLTGYTQCVECFYERWFFGTYYVTEVQSGNECSTKWWEGTLISTTPVTCDVLPIELSYFNVNNSNGVNIIIFETATEINNDFFVVEHSINGNDWDIIEEVNGSGNSNSPTKYVVEHNDYSNGDNYYRLTQYDYNGDYEVFDIITIENTKIVKIPIGVYNKMGQEVSDGYNGVKIYRYSDGSFDRVLIIN